MRYLFTSESVTEGHPDKMCDLISDGVLDAILKDDPNARVACETTANTGVIYLMGEITTTSKFDVNKVVRDTIREIGYVGDKFGFDANTCAVITSLKEQSPDIAQGTNNEVGGAGDQGMMFGYACNETSSYMPMAIYLAHALTRKLASVRKSGELDYLGPDGKSQVTVEYADDKPVRVDTVVISNQHLEEVEPSQIYNDIVEKVILKIIPGNLIDESTKILINPTGKFVVGGPVGDSGLTGRKIIVDTYGGYAKHGGGAFSGKDPTKVDRSAAYAARHAAKNVVASGIADKCEIQLSYAIGVPEPVSINVNTFGTGRVSDERICEVLHKEFDFTPQGIIRRLDLRRPIYQQTAAYGHFGRSDVDLPWEKLDMMDVFKDLLI